MILSTADIMAWYWDGRVYGGVHNKFEEPLPKNDAMCG